MKTPPTQHSTPVDVWEIAHGQVVVALHFLELVQQIRQQLLLRLFLACAARTVKRCSRRKEGRTEDAELVAQVVQDVDVHFEHPRALDQLVHLAHRAVARQRPQICAATTTQLVAVARRKMAGAPASRSADSASNSDLFSESCMQASQELELSRKAHRAQARALSG